MINAPYDPLRSHDVFMERFIKEQVIPAIKAEQDWIHFNAGMTGTGKTSLGMFMYEDYDAEHASIDYVALNRRDYAVSMKQASRYEGLRFVMWDEADANKRDALNQFNKDAISMNWAVRGVCIFQQWNNPSAEWLDRPFIEEKINSFSFCFEKVKHRPRRYLFFTRAGILALLRDYGDLKHETIRKHGKKYALFMGWYKAYHGKLWPAYQAKKQARMTNKIDEFYKKWGKDEGLSTVEIHRRTGKDRGAIERHKKLLGLVSVTENDIPLLVASIDGAKGANQHNRRKAGEYTIRTRTGEGQHL